MCLFAKVLWVCVCVRVSPFLGNSLFLAKQAAGKSAVTSVTHTHHQHHHHHLHPSLPSRRGTGWESILGCASEPSVPASIRWGLGAGDQSETGSPVSKQSHVNTDTHTGHTCLCLWGHGGLPTRVPRHLNSVAASAQRCTLQGKNTMETLLRSSWGQLWRRSPCWTSKAQTWNMCLNRCPHSALQQYVLLPESDKGRRGKSAQTHLHMLTVYSRVSANAVWSK